MTPSQSVELEAAVERLKGESLVERLSWEPGDCPFCGRDPYHYVDNGVGMERVAVTCCDEGIALFQHCDPVLSAQIALRSEAANEIKRLEAALSASNARVKQLEAGAAKANDEVCQALGKALGYPWFKDDQANFPGATEANGVCVGEHVAESIADEAAARITTLEARALAAEEALRKAEDACAWAEKALERYDNALGLDVDEAALIAWRKCGDVREAADARTTLASMKEKG